MQFVDINGKTLPEIIKEYEEKINSLYETTKKRTVYTSAQGFDSINTMYQLSDLNEQEGIDTGSIIYFSENGWLAIARNIDKVVGSYYVINPVQIKGEKGTDGVNGKEIVTVTIAGTKVEDDTTVTTNQILYNDDSHTLFSVYAKNGTDGTNGKSVTNAHTVSHSVVGDETVTNVEFVIDGVTPNPTVEIHAQNGRNSEVDIPYIEITGTNGTLTTEQFSKLNSNKNSYILYNDGAGTIEKLTLSQSITGGGVTVLTYSTEMTAANGIRYASTIIVTKSDAAIVYNLYKSAKEYLHTITLENSGINLKASISVILHSPTVLSTFDLLNKMLKEVQCIGGLRVPGSTDKCLVYKINFNTYSATVYYFNLDTNRYETINIADNTSVDDYVTEIDYNNL